MPDSTFNDDALPGDLKPASLLSGKQLCAEFRKHNIPLSDKTLATWRCLGTDGPPFEYWGRHPLYRWGTAWDWAINRMSAPTTSTSGRRVSRDAGTGRRPGRPRLVPMEAAMPADTTVAAVAEGTPKDTP